MRWIRFRFWRTLRQRRRQGRLWIEKHPWLTRVLEKLGCLHADEYALARGIAIGLLIGLTPTVGVQIILMISASWFFRGNFLAAFAVSWVSNPLTMAPLYYGWHQIGEAALGWLLAPLANLPGFIGNMIDEWTTMLAGSLLIAIPASIGGYFLSLWISRRRSARKTLRNRPPLQNETNLRNDNPDS